MKVPTVCLSQMSFYQICHLLTFLQILTKSQFSQKATILYNALDAFKPTGGASLFLRIAEDK